jgi:hypothetical protein
MGQIRMTLTVRLFRIITTNPPSPPYKEYMLIKMGGKIDICKHVK